MRIKIWLTIAVAAVALALPAAAFGQCANYTTVTGTVTDPSGIPWNTGTVTASLTPTGPTAPTCTPAHGGTNLPFSAIVGPTALDGAGSFSLTLPTNSGIQPSGSQWQFHFSIVPGVPTPFGTGPQFFTVTVTLSGSTQSITSQITSAPVPYLTIPFTGSVTGCALPGGGVQYGVLYENPKGTCFDNGAFTWNPTDYVLQAGFSNSFGVGQTLLQIKNVGDQNTICSGTFNPTGGCNNLYVLGDGNSATGTFQYVVGLENTINETGAAGGYPTGIYFFGNSDEATSANNSPLGGLYVFGSSTQATATGGGQIFGAYAFGDVNSFTSSQSTEEIEDATLVGDHNAINSTTGSGNYSRWGAFGSHLTLSNCDDCWLVGENGTTNTPNFLGLGLSATPEVQITPGAVKISPSASLTLGAITGSTQCLQVNSSGVVTGTGAACGSGGGGGSGFSQLYANSTPVVVSNTTAETTLMQYTVPAGTVTAVGQDLRIRAAGFNNNSSSANATYQYRLYIDSTVVATTSTAQQVTGDKNTFWTIDADAVFSAVGSGGSASADGTVVLQVNNNGFLYPATNGQQNVIVAFNTTTTHVVKVTVQMGTAATTLAPSEDRLMVALGAVASGTTTVSVNSTPVTNPNFNGTTPAAPAGNANCTWQLSGSNASCYSFDTLAGLQGGAAPSGQTYDFSAATSFVVPNSAGFVPAARSIGYDTTYNNYVGFLSAIGSGVIFPTIFQVSSGNPEAAAFEALGFKNNSSGGPVDDSGLMIPLDHQVFPEQTAPSNPPSGYDLVYTDLTTHLLACLTSTGASCMPTGGGSPGGSPNSFQYNNGGSFGGVSPTGYAGVPQIPTEVTGSAPTVGPQGVPIATAITASGTLALTARGQLTPLSSAGAATLTLPAAGSTNFDASFPALLCNSNTGTWTFSSTSTIFVWSGSSYGSVASPTITTGQCLNLFSDNTNWYLKYGPGATGTGNVNDGTGATAANQILVAPSSGHTYTPTQTGTNAIASLQVSDTTFTTGTTAIGANTCTSSSTVTMTGLTTSMSFAITPQTDVSGTTGWGATGGLVIDAWPTANTLNYKVCNQTASSITPGASVTWNVGAR